MLRSVAAVLLAVLTFSPSLHPARAQVAPQEPPGMAVDTLHVGHGPYRIASFVVPGSERVFLNGTRLDTLQYRLDARHGALELSDELSARLVDGDVLVIHYRRFPFAFKESYRRHEVADDVEDADGDLLALAGGVPGTVTTGQPNRPLDPFGNVNLQRSGSITRGIITGNRRDVSMESGLRMQLSGEVAEGVHVQAMLTDENTPIQPEGVTRRLNEFDRVSISIQHDVGRAELGDFALSFGGTRFANFDRKLQGISVSSDLPDVTGSAVGPGRVMVAGATSRGIFQSHEIVPIDGVQGPYRLRGREGERFIIVIAGSEVVYMDGIRLERGETNDYTIDYQTGEISFTARRLVTEDRRIQVEFQYTTIEFTRTVLGARADLSFWQREDGSPRLRVGTTFLREADSKEFAAEFGLSSADSMAIIQAGDQLAFRSGAEPVAFDAEAPYVQYARSIVSDGAGRLDTAYVPLQQAPAPGETVYRVRFTEVGAGRGSYTRVGRSINGLQYEYVGAGNGDYDPIRILPRPEQQRLVGFHGAAELIPKVALYGEWAQSLHDQNRLSHLDAADDVSRGWLAGLRIQPVPLAPGGLDLGQIEAAASRQYTGAHFAAFARTRPVEFGRRWNLGNRSLNPLAGVAGGGEEVVDELAARYAPTPATSVSVEAGRIELGSSFRGVRRGLDFESEEPGFVDLFYRIEQISSRDSLVNEDGGWVRQMGRIREPLLGGRLTPGLEVEHERREQRVLGTDSLARGSLAFLEVRPGITWSAEKLSAGAELEMRRESDWIDGELADAARAWTWMSSVSAAPGENLNMEASLGYRVRRFNDRFRIEARRQDTESIVLRWNGRHTPLERGIVTDWFYEALTERTPTMQEMYIQVTPDYPEAQYVWEDANGDGLIQIDEFLPEVTPNEGTYARTFVPSDSLTSVISVQSRVRFEVDPSRFLDPESTGLARALSQVSSRTVFEVQEKNRSASITDVYLMKPGVLLQPGLTLNGRIRGQQELFLFRRNPVYGLDLSYSQLRALNELASGRESRLLATWRAEGRLRFTSEISARMIAQLDQNRLDSDAFASRRYDLRARTIEPQLILIPARGMEVRASSIISSKRDGYVDRSARIIRTPIELRFMQARRLQVTGRFEWSSVTIDGDATGLARYELTDGRGAGTSYLWHVNGQYRLNEYLRASLAYDGRAPEGAPVLHTLRLQMSAVF